MTVTANSEVDIEFESEMDFCKGMSMTMSMDGFQSALFSNGHPADCITFFFPEWELDRPGKFVGAMSKSSFWDLASCESVYRIMNE